MASLLAEKSAVITTVETAVPVLQNNILALGFADHIPVVEAANNGVAELDTDKGIAKWHQIGSALGAQTLEQF